MSDDEKELLTTTCGTRCLNCRYITISDNVPEHWEQLITIAKSSYNYFWYIYHDKDDTSKHLHLVCCDKAGTSLKAHCERFSSVIPCNMVCKVKSPRSILRYLVHKDHPKKYQYNSDEVISNYFDYFLRAIDDISIDSQYDDYLKVIRKEMSPQDFIKKYSYELKNLNFYQKIMTFDKISKLF